MLDEALRKLPKAISVYQLAVVLTQEPDSCGPDLSQELMIETDNAGGGPFVVLKTDRWAVDNKDDLDALRDLVMAMIAHTETPGESIRDDCIGGVNRRGLCQRPS